MARAERKRRTLDSSRGPNTISSPRKDSYPLTSMTGKNSVNSHMASSLAGGDEPSFTCTVALKSCTCTHPFCIQIHVLNHALETSSSGNFGRTPPGQFRWRFRDTMPLGRKQQELEWRMGSTWTGTRDNATIAGQGEGGCVREVILTHCLPGMDLMLPMEKIFF